MRWAWYLDYMRQIRNAYNILVWKPEQKISLGRFSVDDRLILRYRPMLKNMA
jgi:hypothetical protein